MAMGDAFKTGQTDILSSAPMQIIPNLPTGKKQSRGVQVKAMPTNKDVIYIGASDVTPATGYPLAPGHEIPIPLGRVDLLFGLAVVDRDKIAWIII